MRTNVEGRTHRRGSGGWESAEAFELRIHLSHMGVLEHQKDSLGVREPSVELQHVGVLQVGHNLHLSPDLMLQTVSDDLFLEDDLSPHRESVNQPTHSL